MLYALSAIDDSSDLPRRISLYAKSAMRRLLTDARKDLVVAMTSLLQLPMPATDELLGRLVEKRHHFVHQPRDLIGARAGEKGDEVV
jgi:hypothetical protein